MRRVMRVGRSVLRQLTGSTARDGAARWGNEAPQRRRGARGRVDAALAADAEAGVAGLCRDR